MTTALYREFTLRNGGAWNAVVAFIKANAPTFADKGEPLRLIVTAEERQRNAQQNRFYWGAVLRDISEKAWVDGKQYDKDTWHEFFSRRYGILEDVTLPGGEVVVRRRSTTLMSVGEFSQYLDDIQGYATTELGVCFD
ncbi:recombination protein NinB [Paraburkholderia tropica]|uniref:recombination protein NinB n=1 Tax=Paraburkholderia tropica TaxID=92647 RepID=UPI0007ED8F1D|nr:recombination protein NinB [Paraburkholderia tropica]OBR52351.1 recombinase [Paraburkholderia tropica]